MKNKGNGQAAVLTIEEINKLFEELNKNSKFACLFAICFFTGCRVSEALRLDTTDIKDSHIVFRKSITKGKLKSRAIAINPALKKYLEAYKIPKSGAMFPGRRGIAEFVSRYSADRVLRKACKVAGIQGCSTHSFRRSSLTYMHRSGMSLRTIQKISGHADLGTLQLYLEVSDEEMKDAINCLSF